MPIREMAWTGGGTRSLNGDRTEKRIFYTEDPTDAPPYNDPALPPMGSEHPAERGLFLFRKYARQRGIKNGWDIDCEYSNAPTTSGGGNRQPRQTSNQIGTWRWGDAAQVIQIRCPIARIAAKTVDAAGASFVFYETIAQLIPANSMDLYIEIVDYEPSLADRLSIRSMLNQLHKIGDDPALYKFKGYEYQPIGEIEDDDGVFRRMGRFSYKWDGDTGSWGPMGPGRSFEVGSAFGGRPELVLPNSDGELLYREPHTTWATSPGEEGVSPPKFHLLYTADINPDLFDNWRNLPGMEFVTLT